jgi:pilus assembly protein CpaB
MGRWKGVIPIVLALVVALIASFFLYKWTKKKMAPEVAEEKEVKIVKVAVAKVRLPAGTKIKRDAIGFSSFLEASLPPGHFDDVQKLVGRVVLTPMQEKELILESRLAPVSVKVGGVSALIEPGKRAVTVKGNKVLGVAGFIRPGNRVDIMMKRNDPKTGKETNKIIFENVRVLATGTRLTTPVKGKKGKVAPTGTFTLEVTPEEGERLVLASKSGGLQFALRNATDNETVLTTGATMRETFAQYRPIVPTDRSKQPEVIKRVGRAPARAAPARVAPKGFTLEVIKGLNRTIDEY